MKPIKTIILPVLTGLCLLPAARAGDVIVNNANTAIGSNALVVGGARNNADGGSAVVVGGTDNNAPGTRAVVQAGKDGASNGTNDQILGGVNNTLNGGNGLAFGVHTKVDFKGNVIFTDSSGEDRNVGTEVGPGTRDQFTGIFSGGFYFMVDDENFVHGLMAVPSDYPDNYDAGGNLNGADATGGQDGPVRVGINTGVPNDAGGTSAFPAIGPQASLHVMDQPLVDQSGTIQVGGTGANGDEKMVVFGDGKLVGIGERGGDDVMEINASTINIQTRGGAFNPTINHGSGTINTGSINTGSINATGGGQSRVDGILGINAGVFAGRTLQVKNGVGRAINSFFEDANGNPLVSIEDPVANGLGDTLVVFTGNALKPGGGSWTVLSDRRVKKNVVDLEGSLNKLMKLRPVNYEYKDPSQPQQVPGVQTGMIAQEVETVFPEWVNTSRDGYQSISIKGFEALTVQAFKELRTEKDAQLAEKDEKIADLEARMQRLEKLLLKQTAE